MIKAGIIGGSGYTAGELLRLLLNHPNVTISYVYSTTNAGKPVTTAHPDLIGETALHFTDVTGEADVVFLCLGHGQSRTFLEQHDFAETTRFIDLGNDFRLAADTNCKGNEFIYGLPELNREDITKATHIANPGCFATAIQLALLPLAKEGLLGTIHVNATTGSTGAGVKPAETTHHAWRQGNMSHYKAFAHQHLGEINRTLSGLQEKAPEVLFIPNRGDFARGIFATLYTKTTHSLPVILEMYRAFYKEAAFVRITTDSISLKMAVQTNRCIISLEKHGDFLLVTSVLDNLLKGASGQAVQNMNLMFGFEETAALQLKPAGF